jgi:tetratricopeptide (TPR) repeat protein
MSQANSTAWVIVLGKPPGMGSSKEYKEYKERLARADALADLALRQSPKWHDSMNTKGVALYRAKKYEEALKQLTEARQAYPGMVGAPSGASKNDGSAADQFFLAMTYHRLGKTDEASKWLSKARKWLEAVEQTKDGSRPTVWQRTEWKLHRQEAEQLIEPNR